MKIHCFLWLLTCFWSRVRSCQQRKDSPMDQAQVSLPENIMDMAQVCLPENAGLNFLMPSKRHHPQVEPLLATYKICSIKGGQNIVQPSRNSFIIEKCISWSPSKTSYPCFNLRGCSHFKPKKILLKILWERLLQNPLLSPSPTQKLTFIFSHHFPLFSISLISPS